MNNKPQTLACPVCDNPVIIDVNLMIQGHQFSCTKCDSSFGIAGNSVGKVKETMNKFDHMRANALKTSESDKFKIN